MSIAAIRLPHLRFQPVVLGLVVLFLAAREGLPLVSGFAQDADDPATPGVEAAISNAFTYQGRLEDNGVPAEGPYELQFLLWDEGAAGLQVGMDSALATVINGLFTVELDFGFGAFAGDQRWIEVLARPAGSAGDPLSLGRKELTASPYALYAKNIPLAGDGTANTAAHSDHDHFGQIWFGTAPGSPGLYLENVAGSGIYAVGSTGVTGLTNSGVGVLGQGLSPGGVGVLGASEFDYGVSGVSAKLAGVRGQTFAVKQAGVLGESVAGCSTVGDFCYGVRGTSTSAGPAGAGGVGVRGDGANIGVWGESTSGHGLRGNSESGNGLRATSTDGNAAYAVSTSGNGIYAGSDSGNGVYADSTFNDGVRGNAYTRGFAGVKGYAPIGSGAMPCTFASPATFCYGVVGDASASGDGGIGVMGIGSNTGIWGRALSPAGYAGLFDGRVHVNGVLDGPGGQLTTVTVQPDIGGFRDLGTASRRWRDIYATNDIINTSDARLKTSVRPVAYGLEAILALNPVSFSWIANDDGQHLGLLAQEVEAVVPGVVVREVDDADAPLGLRYGELIPVLIRAIQEQQAEIEGLRGGTPMAASGNTTDAHSNALLALAASACLLAAGALGVALRTRRSGVARG